MRNLYLIDEENNMITLEEMGKWKNHNIEYVFLNTNGKDKDIQMLCYMDKQLVYTSKKNSFKKKTIKTTELKINKWHLPYYKPIEKSIIIWASGKEYNRFIHFCKKFKFKTCYLLQEELKIKQGNYEE